VRLPPPPGGPPPITRTPATTRMPMTLKSLHYCARLSLATGETRSQDSSATAAPRQHHRRPGSSRRSRGRRSDVSATSSVVSSISDPFSELYGLSEGEEESDPSVVSEEDGAECERSPRALWRTAAAAASARKHALFAPLLVPEEEPQPEVYSSDTEEEEAPRRRTVGGTEVEDLVGPAAGGKARPPSVAVSPPGSQCWSGTVWCRVSVSVSVSVSVV
jgi:hypothetical protein